MRPTDNCKVKIKGVAMISNEQLDRGVVAIVDKRDKGIISNLIRTIVCRALEAMKEPDPETPKLQSLKDFNKKQSDTYKNIFEENDNAPRQNGIACPDCGAELFDSYPCVVLTSSPPQKNIRCIKCEFIGFRIA